MAIFIIDNKLYDTNTAEKICTGCIQTELRNKLFGTTIKADCEAILYKSKKGTWFYTYRVNSFGNWYIRFPTENEALKFIQHFDYKKYCKMYGPLEEG